MHSTIGGRKEKKNCHPGKAEFLHEAISTDGDLFHPQEIRDSLSGGYVEKGILAKWTVYTGVGIGFLKCRDD